MSKLKIELLETKKLLLEKIKQNFTIIIPTIIALAGYIFYVIIFLNTKQDLSESSQNYLPALHPILLLGFYIFFIRFILDNINNFLLCKKSNIPYIFPSNNIKNKNNIEESNIKINFIFIPILSLLYRMFTYTGIFLLIIQIILLILNIYLYPYLSNLLLWLMLLSLLYESFKIYSYILINTLNIYISRKLLILIFKIIDFVIHITFVIIFLINFLPSFNIVGGLTSIFNLKIWDILPFTQWNFDILYSSIGHHFCRIISINLVNFFISELLLYIFLYIRKKGYLDKKNNFSIKSSLLIIILIFMINITYCENSNCIQDREIHRDKLKLGLSIPKKIIEAPNVHFTDIYGKEYKLSDYKGKVIILSLWATWCTPCRLKMPHLNHLHNKYINNKDFIIIAVNVNDNISNDRLSEFIKKENYSFFVGIDNKNEFSTKYDTISLPTSYIINKNFNIEGKIIGITDWSSDLNQKLIDNLLK